MKNDKSLINIKKKHAFVACVISTVLRIFFFKIRIPSKNGQVFIGLFAGCDYMYILAHIIHISAYFDK